MTPLKAFEKNNLSGEVKANLAFDGQQSAVLEFQWPKEWPLKQLAKQTGPQTLHRKDNLWQSTCFEAFLKSSRGSEYWEVNLSHLGEWSIYHFRSPRVPQPPQLAAGWSIKNIISSPGQLVAHLHHTLAMDTQLKIGLTAVIENIDGQKSYWAIAHHQPKPDFHDESSYVLERTTK